MVLSASGVINSNSTAFQGSADKVRLDRFKDNNRYWAYGSGRRAPHTDWLKGSSCADDNPSLPVEHRKGKVGSHTLQETIRVPQTEELTNNKEHYQ